jgi:hypothetical protein
MFDLEQYLSDLIAECQKAFGERLLYVGLQGSCMRGEANEQSDIDVMLVIDGFCVQDMNAYKGILDRIGYREKSCGFICGRDELSRWNPQEVCQLRHTTKDLYGSLSQYLPEASRKDEADYVRISLGNLYHELCHRYIHADREKNVRAFRGTAKGFFFLIQNLHYLESGTFVITKAALREAVKKEDRVMLSMTDLLDDYDFDAAFSFAIGWCQNAFARIGQIE